MLTKQAKGGPCGGVQICSLALNQPVPKPTFLHQPGKKMEGNNLFHCSFCGIYSYVGPGMEPGQVFSHLGGYVGETRGLWTPAYPFPVPTTTGALAVAEG